MHYLPIVLQASPLTFRTTDQVLSLNRAPLLKTIRSAVEHKLGGSRDYVLPRGKVYLQFHQYVGHTLWFHVTT